jgi:hypothetical protein
MNTEHIRSASIVVATIALIGAAFSEPGFAATAATAAPAGAEARYQQDRADCLAGRTTEDRKTCLKEAGARLQAARRNDLATPSPAQIAANARRRCEPLQGDDRKACLARADGLGTTTGSVAGGGELHEYREVVPGVPPELPPPAAGPATSPAPVPQAQ